MCSMWLFLFTMQQLFTRKLHCMCHVEVPQRKQMSPVFRKLHRLWQWNWMQWLRRRILRERQNVFAMSDKLQEVSLQQPESWKWRKWRKCGMHWMSTSLRTLFCLSNPVHRNLWGFVDSNLPMWQPQRCSLRWLWWQLWNDGKFPLFCGCRVQHRVHFRWSHQRWGHRCHTRQPRRHFLCGCENQTSSLWVFANERRTVAFSFEHFGWESRFVKRHLQSQWSDLSHQRQSRWWHCIDRKHGSEHYIWGLQLWKCFIYFRWF